MGEFGPWHIVIVLIVFALLFGGKRLPDAARGLGQSLRIFRREMNAQPEPASQPTEQAAAAEQPPAGQAPAGQPPAEQTAPPAITAPEPVATIPAAQATPAEHA